MITRSVKKDKERASKLTERDLPLRSESLW